MPADAARVALVTQAFRSEVRIDSAVQTAYGGAADDTGTSPVASFLDETSDAAAELVNLMDIWGTRRRVFQIVIEEPINLAGAWAMEPTVPTVRLVDAELGVDMSVLVASVDAIDYESGKTLLTVLG